MYRHYQLISIDYPESAATFHILKVDKTCLQYPQIPSQMGLAVLLIYLHTRVDKMVLSDFKAASAYYVNSLLWYFRRTMILTFTKHLKNHPFRVAFLDAVNDVLRKYFSLQMLKV